MTEERKGYHVRMAKADPAEVEKLRVFMAELEEMVEDRDCTCLMMGEYVHNHFPVWRRTVEGYSILVENACDPALTYLDWKPELKEQATNLATLHAENEAMRKAAADLIAYRDAAGPLNFQLEKADDFIERIRAAL